MGDMVVSITYMLGVATMCMESVANLREVGVFINYMLGWGVTRGIYLGIVSAAAGLFSLVSLVSPLQRGPCSCS